MDFINFHTSVLDSAEFMTATPTQRGTWLCLYRYCAGQENRGRIEGARGHTDRTWLQLCGVSLREVAAICGLWSWEGETLIVTFYNQETEKQVQRLRSQAAAGAHARWHKNSVPVGIPEGIPQGTLEGIDSGNGEGDAKGKGKKGNEREYQNGRQLVAASGHDLPPQTPNSKRRLKAGSTLPSEHPEALCQRMIAAGALKGRLPDAAWTDKELEAFANARLDRCTPEDFEAQLDLMRTYYFAKIPREIDIRRRDLIHLLANWSGELDKARTYRREHSDGITKA